MQTTAQERADQILLLWKAGATGAQILSKLKTRYPGLTRNAVYGTIDRLRRSEGSPDAIRVPTRKVRDNKPPPPKHLLSHRTKNDFAPTIAVEGPVPPPSAEASIKGLKSILKIVEGDCKSVEASRKGMPYYCGKAVHRGSYCKDHYLRYYRPIQPKPRSQFPVR